MRRAQFAILPAESNATQLVIRDVGPWDRHPTVTNDAEEVVRRLAAAGLLHEQQQLLYYDSDGVLDEITHERGRFTGFRFCPATQAIASDSLTGSSSLIGGRDVAHD